MAENNMYSELKNVELPLVKTLESLGWTYLSIAMRESYLLTTDNPFLDYYLTKAIIKLNGQKGVDEGHARAIVHKLKRLDSNEEFASWVKGEKSYKLNQHEKAVTINLIDFDQPQKNSFLVANQFKQAITNTANTNEKNIIPDLVLFINGIPITVIECKVLSTPGSTVEEGIKQIGRYQSQCPRLFIPNAFNISTDGYDFKYGATGSTAQYYFDWKFDNGLPADYDDTTSEFRGLESEKNYNPYIDRAVFGMLNHATLLDLIKNFIVFETTDDTTIKKIARYQQVRATNKIVDRVVDGSMKTGLIWHTQGSGKSLTMLMTAWKLRNHPRLKNPTILIVVDRKDLDTQISGTFQAARLPNTTRANSISDLKKKLLNDRREVIITTVFKFNEMKDILLKRENIIVLIDEAHRSQEGLNAIEMRYSLPNAYFFGFTGTPIDRSDHNTHRNFGLRQDKKIERYLDLYNIRQAIDDGATVPVHYQLRNRQWHLDGDNLDKIVEEANPTLTDDQLDDLKEKVSSYTTFMMSPERLRSIAEDIAGHFRDYVEPNGYKAQVVCYTRKACVIIKEHLDTLLGREYSEIVFTGAQNDSDDLRQYHYSSDEKRTIVSRFKNVDDPLKLLLVQSMLLTGFDAPVEQVMYLDRPLRDHTLLQAIARTNRPYHEKESGIIIDYCGILRRLKNALNFNENEIEGCLIDFDELKAQLPEHIMELKSIFIDVNIGNLAQCLKYLENSKAKQARFQELYHRIQSLYETIAPDPFVMDFTGDYQWATQLMIAWKSMNRPPTDRIPEEILAKTRKLIQEHINLDEINRSAPIFVIDDNYLRRINELPPDPELREILIEKRLRYLLTLHMGNLPVYHSLMERLEMIIRQKNTESQDTLALLTELVGSTNEAVKLEASLGQSVGDLALDQLISSRVRYDKPDEISNRIKSVVADHRFHGWQIQASVHAAIKRDIIIELAKFMRENPDCGLDPDQFSDLSKEALKYIEKYY